MIRKKLKKTKIKSTLGPTLAFFDTTIIITPLLKSKKHYNIALLLLKQILKKRPKFLFCAFYTIFKLLWSICTIDNKKYPSLLWWNRNKSCSVSVCFLNNVFFFQLSFFVAKLHTYLTEKILWLLCRTHLLIKNLRLHNHFLYIFCCLFM